MFGILAFQNSGKMYILKTPCTAFKVGCWSTKNKGISEFRFPCTFLLGCPSTPKEEENIWSSPQTVALRPSSRPAQSRSWPGDLRRPGSSGNSETAVAQGAPIPVPAGVQWQPPVQVTATPGGWPRHSSHTAGAEGRGPQILWPYAPHSGCPPGVPLESCFNCLTFLKLRGSSWRLLAQRLPMRGALACGPHPQNKGSQGQWKVAMQAGRQAKESWQGQRTSGIHSSPRPRGLPFHRREN